MRTVGLLPLCLALVLTPLTQAEPECERFSFNPAGHPGNNWEDSYSADGKCYCASTFDHDIGKIEIETPAGIRTVREICDKIGPGPGKGKNPKYNDIQCGNGPANNSGDEDPDCCPGRVDLGTYTSDPEAVGAGCRAKGPKWDLSVFTSVGVAPVFIGQTPSIRQSGGSIFLELPRENSGALVEVYALTGKRVSRIENARAAMVQLTGPDWQPGMYHCFVRLDGQGTVQLPFAHLAQGD